MCPGTALRSRAIRLLTSAFHALGDGQLTRPAGHRGRGHGLEPKSLDGLAGMRIALILDGPGRAIGFRCSRDNWNPDPIDRRKGGGTGGHWGRNTEVPEPERVVVG